MSGVNIIPFIPKGLFWIYFFVGPFVILLMLMQDGSECVLFLHVIHLLIHLYTFPVCCFYTICVTVGFKTDEKSDLCAPVPCLLQVWLMYSLRGLAEILCRIFIPPDLPSSLSFTVIVCFFFS